MYGNRVISIYHRVVAYIRQVYWRIQLKAFGSGSFLCPNVTIMFPGSVSIGNNSAVGDFCHIWGLGGLTIEDNVLIAAHCVITTQSHDHTAYFKGLLYRETKVAAPINIQSNVWIGSNSTILPGVTIGKNSIIGAGSVVTKSIPENVVAHGVPARVVQQLLAEK